MAMSAEVNWAPNQPALRQDGKIRVGVLSTREHPLLPYLLAQLERVPGVEPVLLLDSTRFSERDRRIFAQRTAGTFPPRPIDPYLERFPWVELASHNDDACRAHVAANDIQLLLNGGTPRMVGASLLSASPAGVLNVHPGLLPKYRGATCCEWAIYNDDPVGVTAHFMDLGLDSGPILFARELQVRRGQTYTDVRVALYRLAHQVAADAISLIVQNGITAASLPAQPEGVPFRPIPDPLLDEVKAKLLEDRYAHTI